MKSRFFLPVASLNTVAITTLGILVVFSLLYFESLEWWKNSTWVIPALIGIPLCMTVKGQSTYRSRQPSEVACERSATFYWCVVLLVLFVFRWIPLISGDIPDGMVWEENETARDATFVLDGSTGTMLHGFSYRLVALFFTLFGASEFSFRLYSICAGTFAGILLSAALWSIFPPATAMLSAVLVLSSPAFSGAALFGDEGFVMTQLIFSGFLLSAAMFWNKPTPFYATTLGVVTALASFEYAAIKPIVIFAPLFFVVASLSNRKGLRWRDQFFNGCTFITATFLLSRPMLDSLIRGADDFFDGRRAVMIGNRAPEVLSERFTHFHEALIAHARLVFVGGESDMLFMKSAYAGVVDPILGVAALCSILAVLLMALISLFSKNNPSSIRAVGRATMWLGWGALMIGVSALWNPYDYHPHRMVILVPLCGLILAEGVAILERVTNRRVRLGVVAGVAVVLCLGVVQNSSQYFRNFSNPSFALSFRNKMEGLCRHLESLPNAQARRYLVTWDWQGEWYNGDTSPQKWDKGIKKGTGDGWGCKSNMKMTPVYALHNLEPLHQARALAKESSSNVLIATRIENNQEFLSGDPEILLHRNLQNRMQSMAEFVEIRDCQIFTSSKWYGYADCPVRDRFLAVQHQSKSHS